MIVLAMVLVVFAFAATVTATVSAPKIDMLSHTLSFRNVDPLGDPIDGGPPGLRNAPRG